MLSASNPDIFPAANSNIFLAGPAGKLELLISAVEEPRGIAVICHPHPLQGGTMNNKVVTTLHKAFHEANMNTVRFNFRGVGKSEGEFADGIGETDDLLAVLNWATKVASGLPIYLSGFSFGSYVSYRVATISEYKDKIRQLISIGLPLKYAGFAELPVPFCPWLVIHGDEDDVADPQLVYDWLEKLGNPATLIKFPNTGHFFHSKLIELKVAVLTKLR